MLKEKQKVSNEYRQNQENDNIEICPFTQHTTSLRSRQTKRLYNI